MKKILSLILLAIPFLFVSCDDDDLPNVKFDVAFEGATEVDGTLYVVQGDQLAFTGVSVTAVNPNHRAVIASASYYWDWIPAGTTIVEPFARAFDTGLYNEGNHVVQIVCSLLEEDCTPATATLTFPVVIVASADDIPGGAPATPAGTITPDTNIEAAD